MKRFIPILISLLILASCAQAQHQSRQAGAQQPDQVVIVQGRPWQAGLMQAAVVIEECAELPEVWDHRAADDPSLSILPRAGLGDFASVRAWAGFELRDTYGCQLAQAGQKYMDISAIEIKCGPAVLQPMTLDETGQARAMVLIFLNWPDAPAFPVLVDPPYYQNGVGGFTDGGGSVGFGFGPGSQLTPGQGGPFNLWAGSDPATWVDRVIGSDMLAKDGWMDNHCTFNPVFQVRRKSGAEPPPPVGTGYKLKNVGPNGEDLGYIPFLSDVPPMGVGTLELWQGDIRQGYFEWLPESP